MIYGLCGFKSRPRHPIVVCLNCGSCAADPTGARCASLGARRCLHVHRTGFFSRLLESIGAITKTADRSGREPSGQPETRRSRSVSRRIGQLNQFQAVLAV